MQHRKQEEEAGGQEIWPAVPKVVGEMKTGKLSEEEQFCSKLESGASCGLNPDLRW